MRTPLLIVVYIAVFAAILTVNRMSHAAGGFTLFGSIYVGTYNALQLTYEKQIGGCVWSNAGETAYRVTVYGLNDDGNTFRLGNDVGDHIHYQVFWSELAATAGREKLLPGSLSVDAYPIETDTDCGNTANTYLTVLVLKTGLNGIDAAPPAIYQDTLSVIVNPE